MPSGIRIFRFVETFEKKSLFLCFFACVKIFATLLVSAIVARELRLKESMVGLRPRQGNLRRVFRLFKSAEDETRII